MSSVRPGQEPSARRGLRQTKPAVSIRGKGKRIWRAGSMPQIRRSLPRLSAKRAAAIKRAVFEAGPVCVWFLSCAACRGGAVDLRRFSPYKAALDMLNKTDADGLAHLARRRLLLRNASGRVRQLADSHAYLRHVPSVGQDHDRTLKPDLRPHEEIRVAHSRVSGVPQAVRYINFKVAAKGLILAGCGSIAKLRLNEFRAGAESITT